MHDGAIVANSGHFDVELDLIGLKKISKKLTKDVRRCVDEYTVGNKRIYVLAEGRLVNLAAAEGHPASVMDMSFATQSLATEYVVKNAAKLKPAVYDVPDEVENWISTAKLKSMSISIDKMTPEQVKYLSSSGEGT
jgi:adenosylhomocysteinase